MHLWLECNRKNTWITGHQAPEAPGHREQVVGTADTQHQTTPLGCGSRQWAPSAPGTGGMEHQAPSISHRHGSLGADHQALGTRCQVQQAQQELWALGTPDIMHWASAPQAWSPTLCVLGTEYQALGMGMSDWSPGIGITF